jgi:hypothetical protein
VDSDTPVIDKVRELNRRLTELLADPQPGIMTWQSMVQQTIHDMHEAIS